MSKQEEIMKFYDENCKKNEDGAILSKHIG